MHLAGIPREDTWEQILPTFAGTYNVFEAACANRVKSSSSRARKHTVGYHIVTQKIEHDVGPAPTAVMA